jgi:Carboxypeptidase regulatory-like domain
MLKLLCKKLFISTLCLFWLNVAAAQDSKMLKMESMPNSDTSRAVVKVLIVEMDNKDAVMGATVLLRRDTDKMHGRVTQDDGRCQFRVAQGNYSVRVQMTGLVSFEQSGLLLEKGKAYTIEIAMVKR